MIIIKLCKNTHLFRQEIGGYGRGILHNTPLIHILFVNN